MTRQKTVTRNDLEKVKARDVAPQLNLTDRQIVFIAAYRSILEGMIDRVPNFTRKPHALYKFLIDARRAAEAAVIVYDGGSMSDVEACIEKHTPEDEDA